MGCSQQWALAPLLWHWGIDQPACSGLAAHHRSPPLALQTDADLILNTAAHLQLQKLLSALCKAKTELQTMSLSFWESSVGEPDALLAREEPAEDRSEAEAWTPMPLPLGLYVGMPSPAMAGGLLFVPAKALLQCQAEQCQVLSGRPGVGAWKWWSSLWGIWYGRKSTEWARGQPYRDADGGGTYGRRIHRGRWDPGAGLEGITGWRNTAHRIC